MTLNEWGLYKLDEFEKAKKVTGEPPQLKAVASKTEADVYQKLKLAYVEQSRESSFPKSCDSDHQAVAARPAPSGTPRDIFEAALFRGWPAQGH